MISRSDIRPGALFLLDGDTLELVLSLPHRRSDDPKEDESLSFVDFLVIPLTSPIPNGRKDLSIRRTTFRLGPTLDIYNDPDNDPPTVALFIP